MTEREAHGSKARGIFTVCVFCGSRYGVSTAHRAKAAALGHALAREGWRLVYGAGRDGLMGEVAGCVMEGGGEVFGVIPTHLPEQILEGLTSTVLTAHMHERKSVMLINSDVFVVLPGGLGTLDELFEVLTLRQLGLHAKPIRILNSAGYWDPVLAVIDSIIDEGFAADSARQLFQSFASVTELMDCLRQDARAHWQGRARPTGSCAARGPA